MEYRSPLSVYDRTQLKRLFLSIVKELVKTCELADFKANYVFRVDFEKDIVNIKMWSVEDNIVIVDVQNTISKILHSAVYDSSLYKLLSFYEKHYKYFCIKGIYSYSTETKNTRLSVNFYETEEGYKHVRCEESGR